MSAVRIALITHHYEPENNAPQRRWSALVPRFIAAGHDVVVFAPPPHYPSGRVEQLSPADHPSTSSVGRHGETIHRVRFREHGPDLRSRSVDQALAAAHSAWRAICLLHRRSRRPDVVISTVPGLPSIAAGWLVAFMLRGRHVVEMRDAWPDLIEASGMLSAASWRRRAATSLANRAVTIAQRRAASVVTTTQAFAEVLKSRGIAKVDVIRNGTNLEHLQPLPPPRARAAELRVLYAGTVGRSQGLETAIQATVLAAKIGVPVRLRIVGSGAAEAELRELASSLSAPVEFVERVAQAEVFAHYQWADTVLVSLQDWAPFLWTIPSKVYEAIGLQRHITGVVRGEVATLITSLDAGDVVASGDAIGLARLWNELALDRERLAISSRAREWALEHVNYDGLADRYLRLLGDLVEARA